MARSGNSCAISTVFLSLRLKIFSGAFRDILPISFSVLFFLAPLFLAASLALSGCGGSAGGSDTEAERTRTLSAESVRFAASGIMVSLAAGHPWVALELQDAQGQTLITQHVTPRLPQTARIAIPWEPSEKLRLVGVWAHVSARAARPAQSPEPERSPYLALVAPDTLPPPLEAALQLPEGIPQPPARTLLLPLGGRGRMALSLTRNGREHRWGGPYLVRLWLPAFVVTAGTGEPTRQADSGADSGIDRGTDRGEVMLQKVVTFALPGETQAWSIPFVTKKSATEIPATQAPEAAISGQEGQQGEVRWAVYELKQGVDLIPSAKHMPLLQGSRGLMAMPPRQLARGIALEESRFPVDMEGRILRNRGRDEIMLPSPWPGRLDALLEGVGLPGGFFRRAFGDDWDRFSPGGYSRATVRNHLHGALLVALKTQIMLGESEQLAAAFTHPLHGPRGQSGQDASGGQVVGGLVPAGGTQQLVQPLYWDRVSLAALAPGGYTRYDTLYLWGVDTPLAKQCTPLKVAVSPFAGWVAMWALVFFAVGVWAWGFKRLPRWAARFPIADLTLVSLMFGMTLLVVSLPHLVVGALTTVVLGPFQFLVEGVFYKGILFLLLGVLFTLVPRPGVYALFYGMWMVAQAALNSHASPIVLVFAGISVSCMEAALWLSGVTRPANGRKAVGARRFGTLWFEARWLEAWRLPAWLLPAIAVGMAEGFVIWVDLHLLRFFYRQYLAEWYLLAQALVQGAYAGMGMALGLKLGRRMLRMRKPLPPQFMGETTPSHLPPLEPSVLDYDVLDSSAPLLRVDNLRFSYPGQDTPILKDVSFSLAPGEIVLLAGPSGSGKTTLLRLIKGLLPAQPADAITTHGVRLHALPASHWASCCALAFQEPGLQVVRTTVRGELAFGFPPPGAEMQQKALERFRLQGMQDRAVSSLSGGELQRTALAALWAGCPRILLLDEPLAHQDAWGRAELPAMLRELAAEGAAVVVAEHRVASLLDMAHKVIRLEKGKPVWQGEPEAFSQQFSGDFSRTYAREGAKVGQTAAGPRHGKIGPHVAAGATVALGEVGFRFGKTAAPLFQGANARITPGSAVVLSGPNGEGKSTLLSLVLGLRRPSWGRVEIIADENGGSPPALVHRLSWKRRSSLFGYLPQRADLLLQADTVLHELQDSLTARGWRKDEAASRARAWLERLELGDLAGRFPHLLSRGERQRLALATTIIHGPKLLVLDEPFAGLDARRVDALLRLLEAYLEESPGRSLLLTTHDLEPVLGFGNPFFRGHWRLEGGALHTGPAAASGPIPPVRHEQRIKLAGALPLAGGGA